MGYVNTRKKHIKRILGSLLSLPSLSIDVLLMTRTTLEEITEDLVASVFLHRLRRMLQVTAEKGEARAMLHSLLIFLKRRGVPPDQILPEQVHSELSGDTSTSKHVARFEECKKKVIRMVVQDFAEVFQVDIDSESLFNTLCEDGMVLICHLHSVSGRGAVFKLIPCVVLGSLFCAAVISRKNRVHRNSSVETSDLSSYTEDILRVWLCSLDSVAFNVEGNITQAIRSSPELTLESWVVYIIESKALLDYLIRRGLLRLVTDTFNESQSMLRAKTPDIILEDLHNGFQDTLISLCSSATTIIDRLSQLHGRMTVDQQGFLTERLEVISTKLHRHTSQEQQGKKDLQEEIVDSSHRFNRTFVSLFGSIPARILAQLEHKTVSNRRERLGIYQATAHVLLSLSISLFLHTDAIGEVYGEVVEEILSEMFMELASK